MQLLKEDSWIQTFTGKRINVFNPKPYDISILDIAHALSNLCRFTGHTKLFYSVAEHSCYVAEYVPPQFALKGLLHDAAEAYLSDVSRPIKPFLTNYREIEDDLLAAIFQKFGLNSGIEREIKDYDSRLCLTEGLHMMHSIEGWKLAETFQPILGFQFKYLSPVDAKVAFLTKFLELTQ